MEEIIQLVAAGYSDELIIDFLESRKVPASDAVTRLIACRRDHAGRIEEVRRELAEHSLGEGLATRSERVRRLSKVAERVEERLNYLPVPYPGSGNPAKRKLKVNAANVKLYQGLVRQIREEMEPIEVTIKPSDEWLGLLEDLRADSAPEGEGPQETGD